MKKLFRKIKTKLSPLLLIPIVLVAVVLTGGYFLIFAGDDDGDSTSNASETTRLPTVQTTTPKKTTTTQQDPLLKRPPTAGKDFLIDSDREEKDYAIADVKGSITEPASITLRVGAAPKQPVEINWSITCTRPDEVTKSLQQSYIVTPPYEGALKLPVPTNEAAYCQMGLNARLTRAGTGRVKAFLNGVRRTGA